jgi:hypothetical protein
MTFSTLAGVEVGVKVGWGGVIGGVLLVAWVRAILVLTIGFRFEHHRSCHESIFTRWWI